MKTLLFATVAAAGVIFAFGGTSQGADNQDPAWKTNALKVDGYIQQTLPPDASQKVSQKLQGPADWLTGLEKKATGYASD